MKVAITDRGSISVSSETSEEAVSLLGVYQHSLDMKVKTNRPTTYKSHKVRKIEYRSKDCPLCGKKFKRLSTHMKMKHSNG